MTNTIAEISIALTFVTNWTGYRDKGMELGFVETNHVATIVYMGNTNTVPLHSEKSDIAVWRRPVIPPLVFGTNALLPGVIPAPGYEVWSNKTQLPRGFYPFYQP